MDVNGTVRWRTVGILVAVITPIIFAAVGWGVLYERVDGLVKTDAQNSRDSATMQISLNSLTVSVATLAQSVQILSSEVRRIEDRQDATRQKP